jgi:hypothetical protein
MLNQKEIEKLRKLYYENHFTVAEIMRMMKISRNTCYKYLRFVDFNAYVKENII